MKATVTICGQPWSVDLWAPIEIAIGLDPRGSTQPNAFFLPSATATAIELGGFVGDTRRGGSCNCDVLVLCPHGNGTHTECIGHVTHERIGIHRLLRKALLPATLLTVRPVPLSRSGETYPGLHDGSDAVITRAALEAALQRAGGAPGFLQALIIRTEPNDVSKCSRSYSGRGFPYLSREAVSWTLELQVEHLLVDLPSIDREDDGGTLPMHCLFWDVGARDRSIQAPLSTRSITEMIYVESRVADGPYLLNIQVPPLVVDAVPSRPVLFAVEMAARP